MKSKKLTETNILVVRAFAENNMRYVETARQLYFHENSIRYHLEQVRRKTGLDGTQFYDLVELLNRINAEERVGE